MIKITKLELYIISAAIILAVLIIGLFWVFNRGEPTNYTYKPSSSTEIQNMAGTTKSPDSEAVPTDALMIKQSTLTQLGLTKLTEPTTVNALVFGDAVAESQGASNKDEGGWHALISKELADKYPGNLKWLFKTTTDATIDDVLTYVPEVTPETDLVILCFGRKDWPTVRLTEFKQNYDQLLVELKAQHPQVDIFLIVQPPVKDVAANNRFFPFRAIIMDLGKKHGLPVIDQWSSFIKDPTPLDGLLADGVNPNDVGYRVFADEVLKGFEKKLVKTPR